MDCLDEETLSGLVTGRIDADARHRAEAHVDGCASCRRLLAALVKVSSASPRPARAAPGDALAPGDRIGRYLVLRILGAGSMGTVVAAYDPDLDRKVSIKVLHRAGTLRGEAKALARLSHPNVVAVYEIAVADGHEHIVMEFVEGQTAAAWLAAPRPWPEVVRVFAAAGRGLAAVHDAGLLHRDVKPSNILLGEDGRVRLGDLGLATAVEAQEIGVMAGTPAYMSPEQKRGEKVDARSDQFSFCVALFEGLAGSRPRGELGWPPGRDAPPRWLRAVLERGLAADPAARFPSLHALLAELELDRRARRSRLVLAAGAVILLLAGLVGGRAVPEAAPSCDGASRQLASVWSPARRAGLARAFAASGRPHAAHTADLTAAALDRWTSAWQASATDACRATRVTGEQSEALLDRRMSCYRRLLDAADEALGLLGTSPAPEIVDRALDVVTGLPSPTGCADVEHLGALPPPAPGATRVLVEGLERRLAQVEALRRAGRPGPALVAALAMRPEIEAAGYLPLTARHALVLGELLSDARGRVAEAEATLQAGLQTAARAGEDIVAAEMWVALLRASGAVAGRDGEALGRLPFADAALARAGDPPLVRAALDSAVALLYLTRQDGKSATPLLARALELRRRALGRVHPLVGDSHRALCRSLIVEGQLTAAFPHCQAGLAVLEAVLGPEHPGVAAALLEQSDAAMLLGDAAGALAQARRGLAIRERTYGDGHPAVAIALLRIAQIQMRLHQFTEAGTLLERAVTIYTRSYGADDPRTAQLLALHAWCARETGRLEVARQELERALAVETKAWGEGNPDVARTMADLGELERRTGELAASRDHLQRAIGLLERAVDRSHPSLATPLGYLGELELGARRAPAAAAAFERALALRDVEPMNAAQLRFGLARALWAGGRDRPRALALAREARATMEASAGFADEQRDVAAWLERHH